MSDWVVVFGSRLLADNWARQNAVNPQNVIMATHPERLKGWHGPIRVVRFAEDVWQPTTFPDEKRVKETEHELKRIVQRGGELREWVING